MSDEAKNEPVAQAAPTPTPPPAPEPRDFTIPSAEYRSLVASSLELQRLREDAKAERDRLDEERLKAMAKEGEVNRAFDEYKATKEAEAKRLRDERQAEVERLRGERQAEVERLARDKDAEINQVRAKNAELESQMLTSEKDREILRGLGGGWRDDTAARFARIVVEGRFESVRGSDGKIVVREIGTGRLASEVLADWVKSDEATLFRAAQTQGGAPRPGSASSPAAPANPGTPLTAEERQIASAKAIIASQVVGSPLAFGMRPSSN